MNYTRYSDLTITNDGDLVIGPTGDLYAMRGVPSLKQDIEFRLKTDIGDLFTQPKIGNKLKDAVGKRNTQSVAEEIKLDILSCLTYGNFISSTDINISSIPINETTILYHIEITTEAYAIYKFDLICDLENGIRRA